MKYLFLALALSTVYFFPASTSAQGCSDAGICTAGAIHAEQNINLDTSTTNALSVSFTAGIGENGTRIFTPQVEGYFTLLKKYNFEVKVPFVFATGNAGSARGLGDPVITCSHILIKNKFSATIGTRIGTDNANANYNGIALPMPYQFSLGTTDIIAALNLIPGRHWSFTMGYQQPVVNYNRNNYLPDQIYPASPDQSSYFASRHLVRKGDILFKATGSFHRKKTSLTIGPLLIYHLGRDRITLANSERIELIGSEGLTLNLAASITHSFKNIKVELLAGTPFIVRDYRPDGLTRALVITGRLSRNLR